MKPSVFADGSFSFVGQVLCHSFVPDGIVNMMDFNAFETNDTYQMPVLFISGSCDWVTPVGLVEEYADSITAPKVEFHQVEGCGHSPQGQLPEEFVNAVKAFLK